MLPVISAGQFGLTVIGTSAVDPNFSDVVLLLHFEGSNGSTTIVDSSSYAHTPLVTGDAQLATSGALVGSASLSIDGTGDFVSVEDTTGFSLWEFAGNDFTVECKFKASALNTGDRALVARWNTSGGARSWFLGVNNSNQLAFYWSTDGSSVSGSLAGTTTLSTGVSYSASVSRVGSTVYLFLDGALKDSDTISGSLDTNTANIGVGAATSGAQNVMDACLIDEVRVTNGTGRYSGAYTPSSSPFPDA